MPKGSKPGGDGEMKLHRFIQRRAKKKKITCRKKLERGRFERSTFQSGDKCDLVRGAGYHLNVSKVKPRGISCF